MMVKFFKRALLTSSSSCVCDLWNVSKKSIKNINFIIEVNPSTSIIKEKNYIFDYQYVYDKKM